MHQLSIKLFSRQSFKLGLIQTMIKLVTLFVILCFDYGNGGTRVKRGTPGGPLGFKNNHMVPGKHISYCVFGIPRLEFFNSQYF